LALTRSTGRRHQLGTQVPLADNVLTSASRAVAGNHRFFGIARSKEVDSVYVSAQICIRAKLRADRGPVNHL
jgi:hypothetical protein